MTKEDLDPLSAPRETSTTGGLPVSPSLGPSLLAVHAPRQLAAVDGRILFISALAFGVAVAAGIVARLLTGLIGLFTNLSFYGRFDTSFTSPAENHLGLWVIVIPVIGAVIVGFMARYGSKAIRGHGFPEAMEQVLFNQSRIPARLTFLKPLSAAFAIGTGGPFGAEGPIIATGGALGSFIGQIVRTTAVERKTLLAAGAAAGMAATFGSPVSAVLLAVELLLFEYRPRSVIPVALSTVVATGVRIAFVGSAPVFPMPDLAAPSGGGAGRLRAHRRGGGRLFGLRDEGRLLDRGRLREAPRPLDVVARHRRRGHGRLRVLRAPHARRWVRQHRTHRLRGARREGDARPMCGEARLVVDLGFERHVRRNAGAPVHHRRRRGLGAGCGSGGARAVREVDIRIGALVGMAAIFAGASRALLTSVVFAFETTRQPMGLLPLLAGCTGAYLVSCLLMQNTIMTEKIVRRGQRVPSEYAADFLETVLVRDAMEKKVITVSATDRVEAVRRWLASEDEAGRHQGYPVVHDGRLVGVVTRAGSPRHRGAGRRRLASS